MPGNKSPQKHTAQVHRAGSSNSQYDYKKTKVSFARPPTTSVQVSLIPLFDVNFQEPPKKPKLTTMQKNDVPQTTDVINGDRPNGSAKSMQMDDPQDGMISYDAKSQIMDDMLDDYGRSRRGRIGTMVDRLIELEFIIESVKMLESLNRRLQRTPFLASLIFYMTAMTVNTVSFFGPPLIKMMDYVAVKTIDFVDDLVTLALLPWRMMAECIIVYIRFWFKPLLRILCAHRVSSSSIFSNCNCDCGCKKMGGCGTCEISLLGGSRRSRSD